MKIIISHFNLLTFATIAIIKAITSQQYFVPILPPDKVLQKNYFNDSSSNDPSLKSDFDHHFHPYPQENGQREDINSDHLNEFPPSRFPPPGESFRPSPVDVGERGIFGTLPDSNSKMISGDYCWDPLFGCDTQRTVLYCLNGRCTCPTGWTLAPGNLPLNTVWHQASKRCVGLLGSGCHVSPTEIGSGFVYCQPGVRCVPHSSWKEIGTCAANSINLGLWPLIFCTIMLTQTN